MKTRFSAKDDARTALAAALLVGPTPCAGRADAFTSEDLTVLKEAAAACAGCHAIAECADAGRFERFGLWGGKVKQPRLRRSKSADDASPGCNPDTAEGPPGEGAFESSEVTPPHSGPDGGADT